MTRKKRTQPQGEPWPGWSADDLELFTWSADDLAAWSFDDLAAWSFDDFPAWPGWADEEHDRRKQDGSEPLQAPRTAYNAPKTAKRS